VLPKKRHSATQPQRWTFPQLFGAPLGGAVFALEILHHQHIVEYYEALLPAIVSSCFSYLVFAGITKLGIAPTWHFPQYHLDNIFLQEPVSVKRSPQLKTQKEIEA